MKVEVNNMGYMTANQVAKKMEYFSTQSTNIML